MTRREFGNLAAGALAAASGLRGQAADRVLDIAEWSYHWYGVEHALLARGTVCNGMQMYVEHWIPKEVRHPYPVVLIHGGFGQASDWLSTIDGRRGWASLFLEQGYKVYVLDRPGQGRNPYQPFVHGAFAAQAPTFEAASRTLNLPVSDPRVAQAVASMNQPMPNNAQTQSVWRSRGAMLLDDIGPAILVTEGDGAVFARVTAEERPALVKGIVAVAPPAGTTFKVFTTAISREPESLPPVLAWLDRTFPEAPIVAVDPHPNRESTALKLADQGCFWVGVQRKQMPYGTISQGQMFVQYMIPAERRYPLPVVMVHGGGGQGTHMMGIGGRPGWVHYFVQAGYAVYWVDRPSYGRSPYHPDALGPSHLPNVPAYEGLIGSTAVFNTAQWPGPGGMNDPLIDQFMACEQGNVSDEAFHSDLVWPGGAELLDRIGPSILFVHAFGGFFAWGVADRRPNLVKAIVAMEINGNPFAAQLRWGLTASPMTYDPPVLDVTQFKLRDQTAPPDSPRPVVSPFKLQAEPAHKWKNLQGIPISWVTSEFGGGGSPVSNVAFLKQAGCTAEMLRLRDYGIVGNGNLMLLEKNNHEVFRVVQDWLKAL
ncbi:MAG TPA: alpha/beta fold hydrolase [Bryobacteraceae bacterium]|nr:alpha/beta fold hydrolase [Bryobacteraceae bacterium]